MIGEARRPDAGTVVRTLAAGLLAATAAGCYTYSYGGYGEGAAPLRARVASTVEISSRSPTVDFAVSDRSHVAIFRVSPDGFARALYPYRPGGPSLFTAGPQAVFVDASARGFGPASLLTFPYRFGTCRGTGLGRPALSFVMLVAAREPLRLDRLRGEVPFRLRPAVLASSQLGLSAFDTMDRLLARLIPAGLPDADWAVDWTYTSVQPPRCARPLRRIAARTPPDEPERESSERAEPEVPRLDPDSVRFLPPRLPTDPPEVTGTGPATAPAPLPPVADLPDVRGTPLPGPEGADRTDSVAGPPPGRLGPGHHELTDHAGRLFGNGRSAARSWRRTAGGSADRRGLGREARQFVQRLEAWADDPREHEFPEPPRTGFGRDGWEGRPGPRGVGEVPDARRPGRWMPRSGGRAPGPGPRGSDVGRAGDAGDRGRASPPRAPRVDREREVRRDSDEDGGGGGSDGSG